MSSTEKFNDLINAVLQKDFSTTKLLLEAEISSNLEDSKTGCTLLHFAARYNSLDIAELLLIHGADVDKVNKFGFTALHYAADHNRKEMVSLLLQYEASIFIKDKHGKTAGSLAASKGYLEIAALLHPFFQPHKKISVFFQTSTPEVLTVNIDPEYVSYVTRFG